MALSKTTLLDLEEGVHEWLDRIVHKKKAEYSKHADTPVEPEKSKKPFHNVLLPKGVVRASNFERSLSTGLGSAFERCAEIVAKQNFVTVERNHDLTGYVPADTMAEIDNIIHDVSLGKRFPNYRQEVNRIVKLVLSDGSAKVSRDVRSDLYLRDANNNEIYFEIKSPRPNKDQCLNTTRKHLTIQCITQSTFPKVRTYYGMAYNPYGEGEYRHSFAIKHLDMKNHVLLGRPFWNLLGGKGAYEDVVRVFQKVGREGGTRAIEDVVRP